MSLGQRLALTMLKHLLEFNDMNELNFTEECKKEVARFAKNFLPILFNLFTTEPENTKDTTRLAVLETTKCYLNIADTAVFILQ